MSNKCLILVEIRERSVLRVVRTWVVASICRGPARAVRPQGTGLGPYTEVFARTELFEVDRVALPDAHAGPSVEPRGAGDALGVHAEGDLADAAPVVCGEGVAKEGEPEPALSPRAAHPDDVYPSLAGERLAEGGAHYLVAFCGQEPEGGIEALRLRLPDEPFEGAARPSPHVPERVLDGLEERPLVLVRDESTDGDALGPVRLRRGLLAPSLPHLHPPHPPAAVGFE